MRLRTSSCSAEVQTNHWCNSSVITCQLFFVVVLLYSGHCGQTFVFICQVFCCCFFSLSNGIISLCSVQNAVGHGREEGAVELAGLSQNDECLGRLWFYFVILYLFHTQFLKGKIHVTPDVQLQLILGVEIFVMKFVTCLEQYARFAL